MLGSPYERVCAFISEQEAIEYVDKCNKLFSEAVSQDDELVIIDGREIVLSSQFYDTSPFYYVSVELKNIFT